MANTLAPFGARPVRYRSGAPYNGSANLYYVPASLAAIYVGDFVSLAGSSNDAAYQGNPVGSLQTIKLATAGTATTTGSANILVGCVVGTFPDTAQSTVYNPASTLRGIWVADDPNLVFEIQDIGTAALAYTDVGDCFAIDTSTAGSAYSGRSGMAMATTGNYTDAGAQLKLLGLSKLPRNAVGKYGVWDVSINNHAYGNTVLGIA